MINIHKATLADCEQITAIGTETFMQTYEGSTTKKDLNTFIQKAFNTDTLMKELSNPNIHYHIIYDAKNIAGYSKIELNVPNINIETTNITKLDRLYLLKKYYSQNIGIQLFNYNVEFSKTMQQKGMWLYAWIENKRAIHFYTKNNFQIVGNYDFVVSKTRSNPNHVMFLEY